ncbi:DNA G:T-mismatch repair endonuclease [Microbacterium testaceum StLB037]|uniref:DNA G:T-mismatch repair endonuclease n=1 Tax=Microbacterium testaceum (strain StLB037) TaxID=979556 RepID=E8N9G3_MICTS|nr:very short patch repair endonuclease [Microbacterium testaceum]BAJ73210.1 DNA G:T-mismatch repair endonuclease [Microbacterium testaceum StLB037]
MYTPWASSDAARKTMQGNRGRDTKAELAVRRLVHAAGLRYRVNARPEKDLRRTADMLFTRVRIAVFIDGCYWHGCPQHFSMPATNLDYWSAKIERNRVRDVETTTHLEARGWLVLRFWEHETPSHAADQIIQAVNASRIQPNDRAAP